MREKLNENPTLQLALIGVLALVVVMVMLKPFGGGGESSGETAVATEEVAAGTVEEGTVEGETLEGSSPVSATASAAAPTSAPPPAAVEAAYRRGETIVLLVYRPGGIDDKLTADAVKAVQGLSDVALFDVSADDISGYSAITGPLGVNQVPALIVIRSKKLNGGAPAPATVTYGFQTTADIAQAIVDSNYKGPQLSYAPN